MPDRQDKWQITVMIDGKPYGTWDTFGGGDVEAPETKYKPGGMAPERSLGGQPSVNNVTVGKLLDKVDWPKMRALMANRVGKAPATVHRQPLDDDGNPWGTPLIYRGKLQQVIPGDTDSQSASAQVWQLVISTEGSVG